MSRYAFAILVVFLTPTSYGNDAPVATSAASVSQSIDDIRASDETTREEAVRRLTQLGTNSEAAQALKSIFENSKNKPESRIAALQAHSFVAPPAEGIEFLLSITRDKKQPAVVHQAAISILGCFRDQDGFLEPRVLPEMLHVFKNKSEDKESRKFAGMMAMGAAKTDEVAKAYVFVWRDQKEDFEIRCAAIFFSAHVWDRLDDLSLMLPALLDVLENKKESHDVRGAAGFSLMSCPSTHPKVKEVAPQASRRLMAVLADAKESEDVRSAAGWTLNHIGRCTKHDVPTLTSLLNPNDAFLHSCIAAVLVKIGPDAKPAVPALVNAFKTSKNNDSRTEVGSAIEKIDPEAAKAAGIEKLSPDAKSAPAPKR